MSLKRGWRDGIRLGSPAVRQEFLETRDRPSAGEFPEQIGEIPKRGDAVLRAGPRQTIEVGGAASRGMRSGKQIVPAAEGDIADLTLDQVRVEIEPPVLNEPTEGCPLVQEIRGGLRAPNWAVRSSGC